MLTAIITGAGQDSSYLAEYLLGLNYKVILYTRRRSVGDGKDNIRHLLTNKNFIFLYGDITDATFVSRILYDYKPNELYLLASQSHVGYSFKDPINTFRVTGESVIMQLDLVKQISPYTRVYFAATSELFGGLDCPKKGYNEGSKINPRSPYAIAKAAGYYAVKNYREAYGLHASSGLLFNHSSCRRPIDFATRKITNGIASVKLGIQNKVKMGNMEAYRDEGASIDYVKAMHLMLQQEAPDDYVVSTGRTASMKQMFKHVCELAELKFEDVYELDERYLRPSDVPYLLGDSSKSQEVLGWNPEYTWESLLKEMYENDLRILKDEK